MWFGFEGYKFGGDFRDSTRLNSTSHAGAFASMLDWTVRTAAANLKGGPLSVTLQRYHDVPFYPQCVLQGTDTNISLPGHLFFFLLGFKELDAMPTII